MTGVLLIGEGEKAKIKQAIERALFNPVPLEVTEQCRVERPAGPVLLADRKPWSAKVREKYPPQNVILGTYRAAISFEQQPNGLVKHLSVSSRRPDKVPGLHAIEMVVRAFGFSTGLCEVLLNDRPIVPSTVLVWLEEFEPGHMAVNVSELVR